MPRTIETMLDNHAAATERRRAGRPVWDHHLNVRQHIKDGLNGPQEARTAGTAIGGAIRASAWLRADKANAAQRMIGTSEVQVLAEAFEDDVTDLADFENLVDALYDLADTDRVWIA